ncbi:MAG TPA: hypothetical protein VGN89_00785 [Phenylobacterium sp.]|nr:hypothetical protein [Phenylobacterium sp.]
MSATRRAPAATSRRLLALDRAFGTYYRPGPCAAPLGVTDDLGEGALGQYAHPFKTWLFALPPGRLRLNSEA